MNPLGRNLRPDALLMDFAVSWAHERENDGLILPGIVPVKKRSDLYRVWDRGDFFRDEYDDRGPATEAKETGFRVSTSTYFCKRKALKTPLPDEDIVDYGSVEEADQAQVGHLTEKAFLKVARMFNDQVMTSTLWGSANGNPNQTGVAGAPGANQFRQWNDTASTPIADILRQRETIKTAINRYPNTLYLGLRSFHTLCQHAGILDAIKQTQTAVITEALLAQLFKLGPNGRVIVLDAARNTAAEGQTASMAQITGNVALLAYLSPGIGKNLPGAVKIFSWREFGGFPGGANEVPMIQRYWEQKKKTWWYEGEFYADVKVTAEAAGVFFLSTVA